MEEKPLIKVTVECYAGHRGEETPRRFWFGERKIEVVEVLDQWLAPDHRYFKLMGDDRGTYILRHNPWVGDWELTFYTQAPSPFGFKNPMAGPAKGH